MHVWTKRLCIVCHYGEEFLLANLAVLVEIKFIYHCLSGGKKKVVSKRSRKYCDTIAKDVAASRCTLDQSLTTTSRDVVLIKDAHSSSSSNRSPISFATLRKFRKLIFPVLSSSKSWNARRISSIGSRASMRSLTVGICVRMQGRGCNSKK
jgi:hypothetical protein